MSSESNDSLVPPIAEMSFHADTSSMALLANPMSTEWSSANHRTTSKYQFWIPSEHAEPFLEGVILEGKLGILQMC